MQTTSTLWQSYQALPAKKYEYKVVIGTIEYYDQDVFSMSADMQLCNEDAFTLGNMFAKKLNLAVKQKETIPKMANVDVYIRMTGLSGPTTWLPKGKYFIDTRKKSGLATVLECYDKALMMEASFIQTGDTDDYPMLMSDAVAIVCTRLSLTFDNPTAIQSDFYIEYPNDLTMREVMGNIADANGGNFIITDAGNLKLIVPTNGTSVATASYKTLTDDNDTQTFDKVTMYYNDTDGFESGTGTNEFVDSNIWATQDITDYVLSILGGYTHNPFTSSGVYVDPAIELGDTITLNSINYVVYNVRLKFDANIVMEISSPGETALTHEYPYTGSYQKAIRNKVTLGASYFGNKMTREEGFTSEKSDGSTKLILNSDILSWKVKVLGEMIDRLYFDAVAGDLKYNGKFGVDAIEALKAEIDIVVSNTTITNILSAQTANIAELTVDRIETSDKVQRYDQATVDKTDVEYWRGQDQFIQFLTAEYIGDVGGVVQTENVYDRFGNQLFWLDEEHSGITDDGVKYPNYPVKQLAYDELVKLEIAFEEIDGIKQPYLAMGAGFGSTQYPERGKFFIKKDATGGILQYIKADGTVVQIKLGENGIEGAGSASSPLTKLDFYANGFNAEYENEEVGYRWTKDGTGKITQLENVYTSEVVPVTWNGGNI
jgi:hypothetical protein